jgi:hypothetical protein
MSKLTRNWLIGTVFAWTLLIAGQTTDTLWLTGASIVVFFVLMIERYDNWSRSKKES